MNFRFLVAHAGCLTVRLTERSMVRLTGSLFVTVMLTVRQSVRQGVRHDRIRFILIKYGHETRIRQTHGQGHRHMQPSSF